MKVKLLLSAKMNFNTGVNQLDLGPLLQYYRKYDAWYCHVTHLARFIQAISYIKEARNGMMEKEMISTGLSGEWQGSLAWLASSRSFPFAVANCQKT